MVEKDAESQLFRRVPIAPPANRDEYVEYRIAEALSYLPDDASEQARTIVTETIKTRMAQYGHKVRAMPHRRTDS
jgi:hypothetical protein